MHLRADASEAAPAANLDVSGPFVGGRPKHGLPERPADGAEFVLQARPIEQPRRGRRLRGHIRYLHAEGLDVREIAPATRRPKDAVVEPDVGVDAAGKDHAGEQEIRADEAYSGITRLETMR